MVLFVPLASPPAPNAAPTAPQPYEPQAVDPQFLPTTLYSPNPTTNGQFGESIAVTPTLTVVGAPNETQLDGDVGMVYLETVATGAVVTLYNPVVDTADAFGYSVAAAGDLVAVGAPNTTVAGLTNAGSVYLFNDAGALLSTLNNPSATLNARFGISVSLGGGYLAVGVPGNTLAGMGHVGAGAVDLFTLSTGELRQLTSPVPQTQGHFGSSVDIDGGLVAIGAPGEINGFNATSGNTYVYTTSTGDDLYAFANPFPDTSAGFGQAVALNGTTLVSGAPGQNESGAAYEIDLATTKATSLTDTDLTSGGEFGVAVAVDTSTILVGAPGEESGTSVDAGNVYVYGIADASNVTAELNAPGQPAAGAFGSSVAEGAGFAAMGGPGTLVSEISHAGAAYVFDQIPLQVTSLNLVGGGQFGTSTAVGEGLMVVGAPDETGNGTATAGNAYVIPLDSASGFPIHTLTSPNSTIGGHFGKSVAIGDGMIAVGAPGESVGSIADAGTVYVYNATTDALVYNLSAPLASSGASFGWSLAFA